MPHEGGDWLDRLARSMASGRVSRREAVLRAGAALVGGSLLGVSPALESIAKAKLRQRESCPRGHAPCGPVCCPVHETCVRVQGKLKCECLHPHTRCSGVCTTLASDPRNCGKCGHRCAAGDRCVKGVCTAPTCTDGIKNEGETDIDCGGPNCGPCADGKHCGAGSDCTSGVCTGGICQTAACNDGVKNGTETDVDCGGGTCSACALTKKCLQNSDCASNACDAVSLTCVASQCNDHKQDGNETDVDCGGGTCPSCATNKHCLQNSDCTSNACDAITFTCVANQCNDHKQDGSETDVDCGGGICAPCATGKKCTKSSDCSSSFCSGGFCQ